MNEETILRFQKSGTGDILGDIRNLRMTSVEKVMDLLDRIDYEYRYDAGASYGTLTDKEAEYRYELLLVSLSSIPGLTGKDVGNLRTQIQEKIKEIPEIELATINEFLKDDAAINKVVTELAAERGIPYDEAKKEYILEMKARVDYYNRKINENKQRYPQKNNREAPNLDDGNR